MGSFVGDSWMKEYSEAEKLAEDINGMLTDKAASGLPESESQRYFSSARRKITILGTRLDGLEALLCKLPSKKPITDKELNRRRDMISNLRVKTKQMASDLSISKLARDSLLGPEIKPADAMTRTAGLDNQGILTLQQTIIKEQDDGLEKLEESVISTKHIALAVNEELELHTRLIDSLDFEVDVTGSKLQRLARSIGILNRRTKASCSCLSLMLSVVGIVILIVVIWLLIRYL